MIDESKLKELLKNSLEILHSKYSIDKPVIDHAAYQAKSRDEYLKTVEKFDPAQKEKTIQHAGRELTLFNLKNSIEVDGVRVSKISIKEPKPGAVIEQPGWEHISIVVDDFDQFVKDQAGSELELDKVRQIGDLKFGYHLADGFRIQFRNMPIGEESEAPKQVVGEDFKKLYEQEKEAKLMALAEIQNEKKRMERQRDEFMKIANAAMVRDLFEIVDDLNRAQLNNKDNDSLKMIFNKLLGILNNYGIVPLSVREGDKFDINMMEALSTMSVEKEKDNTVIHVDQLGFKSLEDDRIIRNAKVIVGKAQ